MKEEEKFYLAKGIHSVDYSYLQEMRPEIEFLDEQF